MEILDVEAEEGGDGAMVAGPGKHWRGRLFPHN
jgi:hypothetical protein